MKVLRIFVVLGLLLSVKLLTAQVKHEQTGQASYYSDKFQGRHTSSGEIYNKNKYTAAHAYLPFNTWLRVTNLKNNKSVIVKVNDRCMYSKRRILDLSRVAAQELDILYAGVANVKIESVPDSTGEAFVKEKTAPVVIPPTNPLQLACGYYSKDMKLSHPKGFGVQIISLKNVDTLAKAVEAYDMKYREAINIRVKYFKVEKYHIIILGEFPDKSTAESLRSKLINDFSDCLVVNFDEI